MLSLKRLAYVLLIVVSICTVFIVYNINEDNNRIVAIQSKEVIKQELVQGEVTFSAEEPIFYVVGTEEEEIYKDIFRNVKTLMEDLKLTWEEKKCITTEELKETQAVFVFCDDSIGKYVDLEELGNFIEKGGKVIFAAGLAEGYEDAYLLPVMGILDKTVRENYVDYVFLEDFFPVQEEEMNYAGYTISTWLDVNNSATVYIQEKEKGVPIVYTHAFGKGEALVINATFLDNAQCLGVLTSGIGVLLDDFLYPVMGVECVYLDNFPVVTYVNDPLCMKLYGRTTEAFVRDVVWPVFQGMCVRNELKYTSSVLNVTTTDNNFPTISDELFGTMGKSALQYNGELSYAVYADNDKGMYRNEAFIRNFESTFINYQIGSVCMMSEGRQEEALEILGKDIVAIRGKLTAENKDERLMISEKYMVFPEATRGIELDAGNLFAIHSVFSGYGMISHTFDVNKFISMDESTPVWDTNKYWLEEFEDRVVQKYNFLYKTTLSETTNWVNSYENLEYAWGNKGKQIEITAKQFVPGQSFLLRTDKEIVKATGAEVEKISDNYYMLRLKASKAVLEIAKGE